MSQNQQTQHEFTADAEWEFGAKVEIEPLVELLEAADELVSECVLHVDETRVWLSVVDPANVAMMDASAECVINADGETAFGVGTDEFLTQLDKFDSHDGKARLWLMPREKALDIRNDYDNREVMVFNPNSVRREPDPPDLDYDHFAEMDAYRFVGALEGIADVSAGPVMLEPCDGFVRFHASTSYRETEWTKEWGVEADSTEGPVGVFTASFLKSIARGMPTRGSVELAFGEEVPLRIDNGEGYWYMIAPRLADYPNQQTGA